MKRLWILMLAAGLFLLAQPAEAQWTSAKRLTWSSGDSYWPSIAVDPSGNLHVVWGDYTPGNQEIYYKKSTDGGVTWTSSTRLTWTSGDSVDPAITVDSSGYLHVVFEDTTPGNEEIYYKKSTDAGATWSGAKRLTFTDGYSWIPSIVSYAPSSLFIVWYDATPGNDEVYFLKSTDAGATWSTSQRLTTTANPSIYPAIAVDSVGGLHVVWSEGEYGAQEIYYQKSTDSGETWSTIQRLTWTAGDSIVPEMAVGPSDKLHLVWCDNTSENSELYYKSSTDFGSTWTSSKRLTWTTNDANDPSLSIDALGTLALIWESAALAFDDLYYKKSTDAGLTWSTSQRILWASNFSWYPDTTVDASGNINLVWSDIMPGNFEIYFKKGK
jgi:hypothetical protein